MDQHYDYKQFAILYVDDEEMSLRSFTRAFEDQFRVLTATNARDGLKILEAHKHEIGLLMTDQKMPGEKGIWLLEKARQIQPNIVRVLATAFSEYDVAVAAINTGAIYKFVSKPWEPEELEITLKRSLEFFIVQKERDQLLRERLSVLQNTMIADRIVSLGMLAAGLSHHMRNSLQAVQTFLDLAPAKLEGERMNQEGLRDPEFWKEYYQTVQNQIFRINEMLSDLHKASETSPANLSGKIELRSLVQDVMARLKSGIDQKQLRVENQIPESLAPIAADNLKIQRCFELLLSDEIANVQNGGRIVFSGRPCLLSSRPAVEIQLVDDGPGLPQDALRLLFDPFTVRADLPKEYGINLMACFFLVHHHGGRIQAASVGERGTVFTIQLPLDPGEIPAPNTTTDSEFLRKSVLNQNLWQKLTSS
jgi:two-component system probable response regulator PhcQ